MWDAYFSKDVQKALVMYFVVGSLDVHKDVVDR